MDIKIIEGTKKPINRSNVMHRNKPRIKDGKTIPVKNPLIQFDITVTETQQRKGFWSTETATITRFFHVKAFCSTNNIAAVHDDLLLHLQNMPTDTFNNGYVTGNGCQYHWQVPHLYNDIYLTEYQQ